MKIQLAFSGLRSQRTGFHQRVFNRLSRFARNNQVDPVPQASPLPFFKNVQYPPFGFRKPATVNIHFYWEARVLARVRPQGLDALCSGIEHLDWLCSGKWSLSYLIIGCE